jgi:hypothetical protein
VADAVDATGVGEAADDARLTEAVEAPEAVEVAEDSGATDDVEASLSVALLVLGGVKVALLGDPVEIIDETSSDAGTLRD